MPGVRPKGKGSRKKDKKGGEERRLKSRSNRHNQGSPRSHSGQQK
jgi:hypothetical protein